MLYCDIYVTFFYGQNIIGNIKEGTNQYHIHDAVNDWSAEMISRNSQWYVTFWYYKNQNWCNAPVMCVENGVPFSGINGNSTIAWGSKNLPGQVPMGVR